MTSSDFAILMGKIRTLSPSEKAALREALGVPVTQLVKDKKKEHAEWYIAKMNEVLGGDVRTGSRLQMHVYARAILSYTLRREEYTWSEIGQMLNRNHATIIHGYNLMEDALTFPRQYIDLMHIYNQFKTAIGQ